MSSVKRWWVRAAAALAGIGLALVVPALAWAAEHPGVLAVTEETSRRRPRVGFFGGLATLCCLLVVVAIVLLIVLAARRRRPPGG
ncbi:MAG TPA: hypothetical protein VFR67_03845 [Pilimelia sp.]|nr:hypothetical protein [Pilimelia sp.]